MADDSNTTIRTCTKCGAEKPATFAHFDNYRCRGKVLQRRFCRECQRAQTRAYRAANPDKVAVWEKRNHERNRGAGSDFEKRRYAARDKTKAREDAKRWKAENPDKARALETARNERIKAQRLTDPDLREKLNKKSREWQRQKRQSDPEFREKCNAATREWLRQNKEAMRPYYRQRAADRRASDVRYRIMASVRSRVHKALKRQAKNGSVTQLVGISTEGLHAYIESQFLEGMTWENWGRGWGGCREWHLDHKTPLASFDLTDRAQLSEACHYTNLQPLWASDNLIKGAR